MNSINNFEIKLRELHSNENLMFKLKVFIRDLMIFNNEALSFLSVKYPEYYFTTYHFTENEIEFFLNFPTSSGLICKDVLSILIKQKINSLNGEVCISHDIAPFMYSMFNINRNLMRDQTFIKKANKFKGLKR